MSSKTKSYASFCVLLQWVVLLHAPLPEFRRMMEAAFCCLANTVLVAQSVGVGLVVGLTGVCIAWDFTVVG